MRKKVTAENILGQKSGPALAGPAGLAAMALTVEFSHVCRNTTTCEASSTVQTT